MAIITKYDNWWELLSTDKKKELICYYYPSLNPEDIVVSSISSFVIQQIYRKHVIGLLDKGSPANFNRESQVENNSEMIKEMADVVLDVHDTFNIAQGRWGLTDLQCESLDRLDAFFRKYNIHNLKNNYGK